MKSPMMMDGESSADSLSSSSNSPKKISSKSPVTVHGHGGGKSSPSGLKIGSLLDFETNGTPLSSSDQDQDQPASVKSNDIDCEKNNENEKPTDSEEIGNDGDPDGDGDKSMSLSMSINSTINSIKSPGPVVTNNNGGGIFNSFAVPFNINKSKITLQMLLASGILKACEGSVSLEYHCQKFVGDLLENGHIRSQETSHIYASPSAWAIACKQIINPDKILRKSGCGWASIKYKGLKLDYYKTVWFKRLREGTIDPKHLNGASNSSDSDSDDEHCILKFGEHLDNSYAQQTKILISCTEFKDLERLQPFHVKLSAPAMALADFHCNISNTESFGYISGSWNGDQNSLKMEAVHPLKLLIPHNTTQRDCDVERNRVASEIKRLGKIVVGWYHSHPRAPANPTRDDIIRQLDHQMTMKGTSESNYIPILGAIISPICYASRKATKYHANSAIQFFYVLPPIENRPNELGRPMHIDYDTFTDANLDIKKLLFEMGSILDFYKLHKEFIELNDLSPVRFDKLKETISHWIPQVNDDEEFWSEIKEMFIRPVVVVPPPQTQTQTPSLDLFDPLKIIPKMEFEETEIKAENEIQVPVENSIEFMELQTPSSVISNSASSTEANTPMQLCMTTEVTHNNGSSQQNNNQKCENKSSDGEEQEHEEPEDSDEMQPPPCKKPLIQFENDNDEVSTSTIQSDGDEG